MSIKNELRKAGRDVAEDAIDGAADIVAGEIKTRREDPAAWERFHSGQLRTLPWWRLLARGWHAAFRRRSASMAAAKRKQEGC